MKDSILRRQKLWSRQEKKGPERKGRVQNVFTRRTPSNLTNLKRGGEYGRVCAHTRTRQKKKGKMKKGKERVQRIVHWERMEIFFSLFPSSFGRFRKKGGAEEVPRQTGGKGVRRFEKEPRKILRKKRAS